MSSLQSKSIRLKIMMVITFLFFLAEIITGYLTSSMALIADSYHMLSDVIALIIAFLSIRMSSKKNTKNTFGWARAEILGALINAIFLLSLCFSILIEAFKRFHSLEKIDKPLLILIVGALGLFVNLIGLCLFTNHGHNHSHHGNSGHSSNNSHLDKSTTCVAKKKTGIEGSIRNFPDTPEDNKKKKASSDDSQLNIKGVFLHILGDALGSVIVICSALVIWLTKWEYRYYIDPFLSIILVLIMIRTTYPLLKESSLILLQNIPPHIESDALVKKLISQVSDIESVHELHIWQLTGNCIVASAHIICKNSPAFYAETADKVKKLFHLEGIHSTTIQLEFSELGPVNSTCALSCPIEEGCHVQMCCTPELKKPAEITNISFSYDNETFANEHKTFSKL